MHLAPDTGHSSPAQILFMVKGSQVTQCKHCLQGDGKLTGQGLAPHPLQVTHVLNSPTLGFWPVPNSPLCVSIERFRGIQRDIVQAGLLAPCLSCVTLQGPSVFPFLLLLLLPSTGSADLSSRCGLEPVSARTLSQTALPHSCCTSVEHRLFSAPVFAL